MKRLTALLVWGAGIVLAAAGPCPAQTPVEEPPVAEEETIPTPELEAEKVVPVQAVDLTIELAKKAIDGFILARDKYAKALDQYETLGDFVSKSEEGKKLEADIKSLSFESVAEWEIAIATVSLTYGAVSDGSDYDVPTQVEEIKADAALTAEKKAELIAWLNSLIPSQHNKTVIMELMQDEIYLEKLKLLAEEE